MRRALLVLCLFSTCFAQTKHKAGIVPNGEGPKKYDMGFGTAVMKVTAAETDGKWSMVDFTANPGMQTVLHRHRMTDETFYVVEGEFKFYVDGKMYTLHTGDMADVPRMTPHAFANLTNKPARLLGTFTPSGFEKFFALTAELVKKQRPGTPEFEAGMKAVMKQVDMEPLGPPPFGKPAGPASH
jgi:quercetin dioxygenase-like cupin family protein